MELLPGLILGVVAIALSTSLSKRLGVAGPLILVAVGLAASWLPILDDFEVDRLVDRGVRGDARRQELMRPHRRVAQLGSATGLGPVGRRFESSLADHL